MAWNRPTKDVPRFSGRRLTAWRTALYYVLGCGAWIILSDRVVVAVGMPELHTYKGLAFVGASALALWLYLRHKLRQQLAWERTLQATADSKARLLAAVSHDLRQPLQSLALFTAVVERDPGLGPHSRQAVDHLGQSVQRMGQLLGAILELAQLDVGSMPGRLQPVPLEPLFQTLMQEMRPQADGKGLVLRHVPCSAVVESDPVLLLTILRNFVANAIRYTDHGRIVVGCRRRGQEWLVGVYDTGPGIPPEQQELIFEEFYQVGNSERDATLGLGLGLAVVERLSRHLGHRVQVRSNPGRGSAFCVSLPRAG